MIKILLVGMGILWLLRFVRSKRACPSCKATIRPERVQSWHSAILPFGGKMQCPKCGHQWKE